MIEVSEMIVQVLKSNPGLLNVVGDRIYPLVAKEGVSFPFAVYRFGEVTPETKDAGGYLVNVTVWFDANMVTEAFGTCDVLKEMVEGTDWDFVSTNADFESETMSVYSEINFKITK